MMPRLSISTYDRPDVRAEAAAMAIMQEAFPERYGEAWTAAQLAGCMAMPRVFLSVAHIDAACMGFTLTRHVADEAELLLLAVAPSWRRRGVGKALLKACIDKARSDAVVTLHLEVRDGNPAMALYDVMGFENIHRRPGYYRGRDGDIYDALSYQTEI